MILAVIWIFQQRNFLLLLCDEKLICRQFLTADQSCIYTDYFQIYLDKVGLFQYNNMAIGVWRSLVSRLVRVQEASGSNPDTPTNKTERASALSVLIIEFRENTRPLGCHPRAVFAKRRASGGITPQAELALLRVQIPTLRPIKPKSFCSFGFIY